MTTSAPESHTTGSIAQAVEGVLHGPSDKPVLRLGDIHSAGPDDLTFLSGDKLLNAWSQGQAGAVLADDNLDVPCSDGRAVISVKNAELAMAKVLGLFAPPAPHHEPGVHATATVHPDADLGQNVCVGPGVYVGPGAKLGEGCVLYANAVVMDEAVLGAHCVLWPNAVVRDRCVLGAGCILHPGAVVGADGFGYRPDMTPQGPVIVKVPQIGTVTLGDHCEIGACACVDRAKFGSTTLGHGCKLDNHVQIGHNCTLGHMVLIAGCTAVGGSVSIGDGTLIGGLTSIKDHVKIGRGVILAGGAALMNNIPDSEKWSGYPAGPMTNKLKEQIALRKLPELMKLVKTFMKDQG